MIEIFTIGQLAKAAGVHVETIRYYQRRGLIAQPAKPVQGHRSYPQATLARILFIKRAQGLGFTLEEIANLLCLNDRPCAQVQALAEHKLGSVKEKLADLKRLELALHELLSQCRHNDDDSRCPIIDALQP